MTPTCGFFGMAEGDDDLAGYVTSDGHLADGDPAGNVLSFFIPMPGGVGGARVLVCEFHGAVLAEMYGQGKMTREDKGQLVRAAWMEWAEVQPVIKESWSASWEQLPEQDKEADRLIGERLYAAGQACR
jgi:hypothetical protein